MTTSRNGNYLGISATSAAGSMPMSGGVNGMASNGMNGLLGVPLSDYSSFLTQTSMGQQQVATGQQQSLDALSEELKAASSGLLR